MQSHPALTSVSLGVGGSVLRAGSAGWAAPSPGRRGGRGPRAWARTRTPTARAPEAPAPRAGRRTNTSEVSGDAADRMWRECRSERREPCRVRSTGQLLEEPILRDRGRRALRRREPEREAVPREQRTDRCGRRDAARSNAAACAAPDRACRSSRKTSPLARRVASSWRIIRSPVRATDGQWIRRRSSPSWYARIVKYSSPVRSSWRARADPTFVPDDRVGRRGEILHVRRDEELVAPLELDAPPRKAERVGRIDREGPDRVPPARLGERSCTRPLACVRPAHAGDHETGRVVRGPAAADLAAAGTGW